MDKDPSDSMPQAVAICLRLHARWLLLITLLCASLAWMLVFDHLQTQRDSQRHAFGHLLTRPRVLQALPDFKAIPAVERKHHFFVFVHALVTGVNGHTLALRSVVQSQLALVRQDVPLDVAQEEFLRALLKRFKLDDQDISEGQLLRLLRRMDVVPPSLAMAQAANESAWGTSRFAREGNNLFGQWCFTPGCGLVPLLRSSGAKHEVKRFDWPFDSMYAYALNLNTHPAYRPFRIMREQMRRDKQVMDGQQLVEGLRRYSERGGRYVKRIRDIMIANDLACLDFAGNDTHVAVTRPIAPAPANGPSAHVCS